jgi:hypothetical protein
MVALKALKRAPFPAKGPRVAPCGGCLGSEAEGLVAESCGLAVSQDPAHFGPSRPAFCPTNRHRLPRLSPSGGVPIITVWPRSIVDSTLKAVILYKVQGGTCSRLAA